MVTLGLKNAINCAKLKTFIEALVKLKASIYIVRIVVEFLLGEKLYCDLDDGLNISPTACDMPKGSVLSPLLPMYGEVLTTRRPNRMTAIRFGVGIGIPIAAKCLEEIEIYANQAIWEINSC